MFEDEIIGDSEGEDNELQLPQPEKAQRESVTALVQPPSAALFSTRSDNYIPPIAPPNPTNLGYDDFSSSISSFTVSRANDTTYSHISSFTTVNGPDISSPILPFPTPRAPGDDPNTTKPPRRRPRVKVPPPKETVVPPPETAQPPLHIGPSSPKRNWPSEMEIINILSSEDEAAVGSKPVQRPPVSSSSRKEDSNLGKRRRISVPDSDDEDPMRLSSSATFTKSTNHAPLSNAKHSELEPPSHAPPKVPHSSGSRVGPPDPSIDRPKKKKKNDTTKQPPLKPTINDKTSYKSKATIENSDGEMQEISGSTLQMVRLASGRVPPSRTAEDREVPKKRKLKIKVSKRSSEKEVEVDADIIPDDSNVRTQRSSTRVAVAKSLQETTNFIPANEERDIAESAESEKGPEKPRGETNDVGEGPSRPKAHLAEQSSAGKIHVSPDDEAHEKPKRKRRKMPEVFVEIPRRNDIKTVNRSTALTEIQSIEPNPEDTQKEANVVIPPVKEPTRTLNAQGLLNPTSSKPTSKADTQSGRSNFRRPNKPLTQIFSQSSTPIRRAGLSKSVKLAPLLQNFSPIPTPPPSLIKPQKKSDNDDEDSDWGATRGEKIKRLTRKIEDLEGLEGKKIDELRKQLIDEFKRLTD